MPQSPAPSRPLPAPLRRRAALAAGVVIVTIGLAGCTTSTVQQRYTRHLSTVIEPDAPGRTDEVALVFGLDDAGPSGNTALAAGPDDAWTSRALTAAPDNAAFGGSAGPLPAPID